jgi:NAD(P)-dependent dehydrogenase (short-subunit alcohol dehydrogenase family)
MPKAHGTKTGDIMADITIIYGGSGGIGGAIARRLAVSGTPLVLVGRDADRLAAVAGETGARTVAGDVTDPALFERVTAAVGDAPVGGLVYAAGTITLKPLGRLTDDDFLADWTINVLGAARAVRAALPALARAEAPSVLLFSSVAAGQGFPAHASIGSAKAAVEGLTRALAAELAPKIRVNAIAPSLTRTRMAAGMTANESMAKAIAGLHPLPRLGEADDMAALSVLLLGATAGWITGQVIGVDGGRSTLRTKG